MTGERRAVLEVDGRRRVSTLTSGAADAPWTLIYAPGAGSDLDDPFGRYLAQALPPSEVRLLRFQFPYMEARRSGPDSPALLEASWRAVIEASRPQAGRLAVGGRSMGGRIATQVAAVGVPVDAVACFAYPLHPPRRPEQRRDAHLAAVAAPLLFCSGTRDDFASPDEIAALVEALPRAHLHLLEGADHGFNVRKSAGRAREDVWREATDALLFFLRAL